MLRGLLRPKWIGIHLGVAALIVLMVNLGFWQLRRLDEKRTFNALVTSRSEKPVSKLTALPAPVVPSDVQWLRVTVEGTYDPERALRVVNRSQDGTAGYDQVVPLQTAEFGWIIVNRGFIPLAGNVTASVPSGRITVAGYLRTSQKRNALGAVDSTDPANKDFQRFDIPLMSEQFNGKVFPMYLQRIKESPMPSGPWPALVAFPELSEGPHQSYAFQWFFFSSVALVAWAVVIRRKWRAGPISEPATPA